MADLSLSCVGIEDGNLGANCSQEGGFDDGASMASMKAWKMKNIMKGDLRIGRIKAKQKGRRLGKSVKT